MHASIFPPFFWRIYCNLATSSPHPSYSHLYFFWLNSRGGSELLYVFTHPAFSITTTLFFYLFYLGVFMVTVPFHSREYPFSLILFSPGLHLLFRKGRGALCIDY